MFDEETDTIVPVEADIKNNEELEFFYDDKVRKVWHKQKEEWYFSVVDVCQVLTGSQNPKITGTCSNPVLLPKEMKRTQIVYV